MQTDGLTVVPIEIRPGVVAQVRIPWDLSRDEAEKIARVVIAYAVPAPTRT